MPGSTGSARALAGELERCEKRFRPHALRERAQAPEECGRNEPERPRGHRYRGGRRVSAGTGGRGRDKRYTERQEPTEQGETEVTGQGSSGVAWTVGGCLVGRSGGGQRSAG